MKSLLSMSGMQTAACFLFPVAVGGALFLTHEQPVIDFVPTELISEDVVADDMKLPRVAPRSALTGDKALAYTTEVERLRELSPIESPFVDTNRYEHEPEADPVLNPALEEPAFKLTSVMSARGDDLCVINQLVRRVGDDLGEGWSVLSIDVSERSVTLAGPDERELVLSQR